MKLSIYPTNFLVALSHELAKRGIDPANVDVGPQMRPPDPARNSLRVTASDGAFWEVFAKDLSTVTIGGEDFHFDEAARILATNIDLRLFWVSGGRE